MPCPNVITQSLWGCSTKINIKNKQTKNVPRLRVSGGAAQKSISKTNKQKKFWILMRIQKGESLILSYIFQTLMCTSVSWVSG